MAAVSAEQEGIRGARSLHRAVILLGPPGAGKGTQATRISQRYNLPHLSTGDMFRDQIGRNTELGRRAKPLVERGDLVPDELVVAMFAERIARSDCENGFVSDGFPRTLPQAKGLEGICGRRNLDLTIVLHMVVQADLLMRRLAGRRICKMGGHIYNIYDLPPKREGICDIDGSELIQRPDDTEAAINIRLAAYEQKTRPLIEYYSERRLLTTVDGGEDAGAVTTKIMRILAEAGTHK